MSDRQEKRSFPFICKQRASTLIRAGLPRYSSHRVHTVALLSASIRCVKRGLCCWCDEMIEWCPSLLLMRIICAVTKLVHTIARLSIEHFFKRAAIKCRCSLQHVYCSARCPELLLCAQGEAVVFSQHLKNRLQMCLGAWVQSVQPSVKTNNELILSCHVNSLRAQWLQSRIAGLWCIYNP